MAGRVIDRVVAVSDFVARRDVEQNMLPRKKVRTIYNGVDIRRFHPHGDRYPINHMFTIIFVGQLIPKKGIDLLIEAVRRISSSTDHRLFLKVAGAGHQRNALESLAAEILPGQVEFLGQVEDVPTLFRSADLAVFPSRWEEAFGFVVAEVMACGTPVIAADAGGIREAVGDDRRAGLLFRKGDVEDLERQVRFLISDPKHRARMRQAARERAEQEYSIQRMVEQHASLYAVVSRFYCSNSIQTITQIRVLTVVKVTDIPHETRHKP